MLVSTKGYAGMMSLQVLQPRAHTRSYPGLRMTGAKARDNTSFKPGVITPRHLPVGVHNNQLFPAAGQSFTQNLRQWILSPRNSLRSFLPLILTPTFGMPC